MSKKIIFISLLLISSISFIALSSSSEAQVCQVNITWSSNSTYTINQNNTYYCLNQSWYIEGVTAINSTTNLQNTTLDCLNYNLDGNDATLKDGIYLTGSDTKNNTIKNCNITDFYSGIYLYNGPNNNTITSNVVGDNYGRGIYLESSSNNTIYNNTANNNYYGIYLYLNSHNNILTNNTANNNSNGGILFSTSSNNTITNNTANNNTNYGIYIYNSLKNTITGGSIALSSTYDYYLRTAGTTNNFTNTNFTAARKIYFYDATSWFNYNNETTGNIWLKTSVSATATITRKLINWNQSLMQWNDTNTTGSEITVRYNITGLNANKYYNIYNNSVLAYTLQTDSSGNLPSFTIYLGSEHEIKVEKVPDIIITMESPKMSSNREIISRPNSDILLYGKAFYTNGTAYASQQLNFTYDTRSLGSNTTNASGYYWFTFSIPYEGSYNLTVKATDSYNNTGENTSVLFISTHPLTVKYNLNFMLGSTKENDLYKKGSKYVCGYDNTEYPNGLVLGLIHSYKASDLEDIGFESASSNGLVGYWKFDESSGTSASDSGGNGNTGTLKNGTTTCYGGDCPNWINGKYDKAIKFDGVNDYVDCGNDSSLIISDYITIEAWIKPQPNQEYCWDGKKGNYGVAASVNNYTGSTIWSWQLRYGAPTTCYLGFQFNGNPEGAKWVTVGQNLTAGEWYHVVGTFNGTHIKSYLNGTLIETDQISAISTNPNNKILIGNEGWANYFNGTIDEVKIYNRVLTADEIRTEYESKFKLKQSVDNSQLLLTYTKGTCQNIEDKMYLVESYAIPSRAFSSFSYTIPAGVPILIQFKSDRIQINGSDRFSAGDHKICAQKSGISAGNKPIIDVSVC